MQIVHSTLKNYPLLAPETFITFIIFNTFNRCTGKPRRFHLLRGHQKMPRTARRRC